MASIAVGGFPAPFPAVSGQVWQGQAPFTRPPLPPPTVAAPRLPPPALAAPVQSAPGSRAVHPALPAPAYGTTAVARTFQERDDLNRTWTAAAIRNDARVRDAFSRWDSLSRSERLAVAAQIGMLQGKVYGFSPARAAYDPSLNGTATLGYFRSQTGTLSLGDTALSSPRRLISTLTHEQAHAYQWEMGVRWNRGQISPGDPVAAYARAWYQNFFNYHDADKEGYATYASQPTETHSFATGAAITRLVFG